MLQNLYSGSVNSMISQQPLGIFSKFFFFWKFEFFFSFSELTDMSEDWRGDVVKIFVVAGRVHFSIFFLHISIGIVIIHFLVNDGDVPQRWSGTSPPSVAGYHVFRFGQQRGPQTGNGNGTNRHRNEHGHHADGDHVHTVLDFILVFAEFASGFEGRWGQHSLKQKFSIITVNRDLRCHLVGQKHIQRVTFGRAMLLLPLV